jgi:hypothetical protein
LHNYIYGLPRGILGVFSTILYENEFQNPQIVQQTISLFPEQSTLAVKVLQEKTNTLSFNQLVIQSTHRLTE